MLVVDCVSKWVEVVAMPTKDAKTIIKFIKKNIFSIFGFPRVLISDGGSHFCNARLKKVLEHYNCQTQSCFFIPSSVKWTSIGVKQRNQEDP